MPNHVTTRCIITGDATELARFRREVFTENGNELHFDFDNIIPMPSCIKESEESSHTEIGASLLLIHANHRVNLDKETYGLRDVYIDRIREEMNMMDNTPLYKVAEAFLNKYPSYREKGAARLMAIAETGFSGWYDWSIKNWGTKWNSYSLEICNEEKDCLVMKFETAWSYPEPIFEKLSKEYPTLRFECTCFDEGWNFAGAGCYNASDNDSEAFIYFDATHELYEHVYGTPYESDDEVEVEGDE